MAAPQPRGAFERRRACQKDEVLTHLRGRRNTEFNPKRDDKSYLEWHCVWVCCTCPGLHAHEHESQHADWHLTVYVPAYVSTVQQNSGVQPAVWEMFFSCCNIYVSVVSWSDPCGLDRPTVSSSLGLSGRPCDCMACNKMTEEQALASPSQ